MVVDDDIDIITTIKAGLETLSANYVVQGCNNGVDCLESLRQGVFPDLIILDIMMPEIDGWDIYETLRDNKKWNKIPVIFLTALDDEKTINRGTKTDAFYMKKPFEISQLKEIIDSVLNTL